MSDDGPRPRRAMDRGDRGDRGDPRPKRGTRPHPRDDRPSPITCAADCPILFLPTNDAWSRRGRPGPGPAGGKFVSHLPGWWWRSTPRMVPRGTMKEEEEKEEEEEEGTKGARVAFRGRGREVVRERRAGCRAVPVPALVTWSRYHAVTWKATHSTPQMVMTRRQPHSRSVETATQVNPSGALVTVYRKAYCTRGRRGRGRRSGGRKGGGGRGRCDWVRSCDRCRWCWW